MGADLEPSKIETAKRQRGISSIGGTKHIRIWIGALSIRTRVLTRLKGKERSSSIQS